MVTVWAVPGLSLVLLCHWQLCCRECKFSIIEEECFKTASPEGFSDDPLLMLPHVEQELCQQPSLPNLARMLGTGIRSPSCHYRAQCQALTSP